MFALALWDRCKHCLQLARDRFGEKPLYWGLSGTGHQRTLLFGSELTALRAWPGFSNSIHRPALAQLLRFSSLAAPTSIYTGIQRLLPGHFVTIKEPSRPSCPNPSHGGVSARSWLKASLNPLPIQPLASNLWRLR